jgi:hypothetical protein
MAGMTDVAIDDHCYLINGTRNCAGRVHHSWPIERVVLKARLVKDDYILDTVDRV